MKYYLSYPIDENGMITIAPGEVMSRDSFVAMLEQSDSITLSHGNDVRTGKVKVIETKAQNNALRLTLEDTAVTGGNETIEQWFID